MIKAIIFDWNGTLYNRDVIFPFTKEILDYLSSKYKLILISKAKPNVEERKNLIKSLDLEEYFENIIVKPDKFAEDYADCIKSLNLKPEEVAIVDDRTVMGIKIGNRLGCRTIWITEGKFSNELANEETGQPDDKIRSIKELKELL